MSTSKSMHEAMIGGELFLPSTVLTEMKQIQDGVSILDLEIRSGATNLTPVFLESFEMFKTRWREFYDDNQGWFSRALNVTFDKVKEFKRQLEQFRLGFIKAGGSTTVPSLAEKKSSPPWIPILIGGGGALFLLAVLKR